MIVKLKADWLGIATKLECALPWAVCEWSILGIKLLVIVSENTQKRRNPKILSLISWKEDRVVYTCSIKTKHGDTEKHE